MKSTLPRIPHLPGSRLGNDDLTVEAGELELFLSTPVVVAEKLDGIGVALSQDEHGFVDIGMKEDWRRALSGRVLESARRWTRVHEDLIAPLVAEGECLYGEWLFHRVAIRYSDLPAAIIFHGLRNRFGGLVPWEETNDRLRDAGLFVVEPHYRGPIHGVPLRALVPTRSKFGHVRPEGIIVERVDEKGAHRAKWVGPHYRQPKGKDLSGARNKVR